MKRSASATARRTLRRASTWRPKARGTEDVDIAALISPLRYDVMVRAGFFAFLADGGASLRRDPDALVEAARDLPYAAWFRSVAMTRFRPWVLQDAALLDAQFRERVLSALALWESFRAKGFDPAHPVTLRAASGPLPTDTGLSIDRRLHVGDGGHRLALLLSAGLPLAAGQYRVDRRPQRLLIDNTAVLMPQLGLPRAEYVRFLARGYGAEDHEDGAALEAAVRDRDPRRADELAAVRACHQGLVQGRC